jgi:putative ABC transport system permease protein
MSPVDWQVQLVPGTDVDAVVRSLGESVRYSTLERVGYADIVGFTATNGGMTQTTGAGKVLGVSDSYRLSFPAENRPLLDAETGVLIAQQTAANLHVGVGDSLTIDRMALPSVAVRVDGIIDLPQADSLFQVVGVPSGAAPQAPPDNVVILPLPEWHQLFDPQAVLRPDSVQLELHVRLSHELPPAPSDAFAHVQRLARRFEARIAGRGVVADNLAARLDGVREDSLYGRVLFLFLGMPGAVLC